MRQTKLGLHTLRALQAAAVDLEMRRARTDAAHTRRINEAHRDVGAMPRKTAVAAGVAAALKGGK